MRFPTLLTSLSTLLLASSSSSASLVELNERGVAITSTTTRTVQAYKTDTVYIYANTAGTTVTTTVEGTVSVAGQTTTAAASSQTSLVLIVKPTSAKATSSASASSAARSSSSTSSRASSSSSSSSVSKSASKTSTTSTAPAVTTTAVGTGSNRPVVAGYYPDWVESTLSPEQIDWNRIDWIDFAFAVLDSNLNIVFTGWNSDDLLKRTVKLGHAAGKKVKLSIGGAYFSVAFATSARRQDLANKMLAVYNQYDLDGVDIDFEYPVVPGQAGNVVSPDDSANYLLFLQLLRATLPGDAKITAATQVWPFAGPDKDATPLTDVSGFAAIFDWITIMNYDVWGSSSTAPGPNAPLSDGCGNSRQPLANAYAAVNSWHKAGMPLNKIMLGTAAYGYISASSATALVNKRAATPTVGQSAALAAVNAVGSHSHKRSWGSRLSSLASKLHRRAVTVTNDAGGTTDGQITFVDLINQGALGWDNSQRMWVGANGFTRVWDACSSTPFLRSPSANQVISYDDPTSLSLKGQFALAKGLAGVNVWELSGDNSNWDLVDSLRSGLGL